MANNHLNWISLVAPSAEEIETISKKYSISAQMLNYALDENEPPRTDQENGVTLILCKMPFRDTHSGYFDTIPLGIILKEDVIITITLRKNLIIEEITSDKTLEKLNQNLLIFHIFNRINFYFLSFLRSLEQEVDKTEETLLLSSNNHEITKLLRLRKTLAYFNTATLSNRNVLEKISKGGILELSKNDSDLLDDVLVENKQAQEMIAIHVNILSDTMEAYASIISNNLNSIMKFLTSFTILLSLPVIIASYYGMNVDLPFQQSPGIFQGILIVSFLLVFIFTVIFYKRKYF